MKPEAQQYAPGFICLPGISCGAGAFFIAIFMHCLFLSEYSDRTGVVKLEIISIMGWVAIREATSIAIMERPELVSLRRCYERIIRARIELEG